MGRLISLTHQDEQNYITKLIIWTWFTNQHIITLLLLHYCISCQIIDFSKDYDTKIEVQRKWPVFHLLLTPYKKKNGKESFEWITLPNTGIITTSFVQTQTFKFGNIVLQRRLDTSSLVRKTGDVTGENRSGFQSCRIMRIVGCPTEQERALFRFPKKLNTIWLDIASLRGSRPHRPLYRSAHVQLGSHLPFIKRSGRTLQPWKNVNFAFIFFTVNVSLTNYPRCTVFHTFGTETAF